jgi:hypothetical protein
MHLETTVCLIFKFYFLLVPNGFERPHSGAPRLCVSLFKFVDCSLRQTNTPA